MAIPMNSSIPKPFSLLVKPASADCNLRCEYCFYLDHCGLYPDSKVHRMSDDVLERMISGYMATNQPDYAFGWQGGEPTLMGVDFFRKVTEFQKQYVTPGSIVSNGLQTNATLINDDLAAHLSEYHFLCGVSMDGPQHIHDRFRVNGNGRGSHQKVWEGIECLRRNNVEFNILTLVSASNVGHAKEVYRYMVDNGFLFLQFIPCVEFDRDGNPLSFAITAQQWGDFLCEIYDEWSVRDTHTVSIRLFDSIVNCMVNNEYNVCHMSRNCCQYFVVEYNGDIYPCDFFVEEDLRLGNIMNTSWQQTTQSPLYAKFGGQKSEWNSECSNCPHLPYCSGDCLKHRLPRENNPATLSWLCSGWKQFYRHTIPGFQKLADHIKHQRSAAAIQRSPALMPDLSGVSRNAPCPCGSGKKFKRCHGKT